MNSFLWLRKDWHEMFFASHFKKRFTGRGLDLVWQRVPDFGTYVVEGLHTIWTTLRYNQSINTVSGVIVVRLIYSFKNLKVLWSLFFNAVKYMTVLVNVDLIVGLGIGCNFMIDNQLQPTDYQS